MKQFAITITVDGNVKYQHTHQSISKQKAIQTAFKRCEVRQIVLEGNELSIVASEIENFQEQAVIPNAGICDECNQLKEITYIDDFFDEDYKMCKRCEHKRFAYKKLSYQENYFFRELFNYVQKELHLTTRQTWNRFPFFEKEIEEENLWNLGSENTRFLNIACLQIEKEEEEK